MQARMVLSNETPLCFRSTRSKEAAATLHYIPGASLLGGLAQAHDRLGRKRDEFAAFFTNDGISFPNLYPADFKAPLNDDDLPVSPIPSTARSCKRFSGFRSDPAVEDEDRHGVDDHLIPWALFAIGGAAGPLTERRDCRFKVNGSPCGQSTAPYPGFFRHTPAWENAGSSDPARRVLTRAGISRQRGAARSGILYHREALLEGQSFWGRLVCRDDLWETFRGFLDDAFEARLLRLGTSRTRGLGLVHQKLPLALTSPDSPAEIERRCDAFTAGLKKAASGHKVALQHQIYVPITLQSDVILQDEQMLYRTALDAAWMQNALGCGGVQAVYACASTRRVMGWNASLDLPRADDLAIRMGSVFLFGFESRPAQAAWQRLLELRVGGIGLRTSEGFGRVTIADPFHTEVHDL